MSAPTLYIGCPLWAQRAWVGRFLPADTPSGRELHAYSRLLNAVEGNATFYASPTPSTVARWREQALPGFRFVFKVPKHITHERRLRGIATELTAFSRLMEPLGDLIGAFTLQLPPTFGPGDLGALDWTLRQRSAAWRWAVEPRHAAFFAGRERDALDALLARHGVERVLLDTRPLFAGPPTTDEGRDEWEQKPRLPALGDPLGDHPIVRCIGGDDPHATADGFARWHEPVAGWLRDGRTPTVFLHTPDNSTTPALALAFHAAVAELVPGLAPLPQPLPLRPQEQGTLFG
jgi:uncharacterized protein YecE (DUF72 family)